MNHIAKQIATLEWNRVVRVMQRNRVTTRLAALVNCSNVSWNAYKLWIDWQQIR